MKEGPISREEIQNRWAVTCRPCDFTKTNLPFKEVEGVVSEHKASDPSRKHLIKVEYRGLFKS